jgi:hypothetical protein
MDLVPVPGGEEGGRGGGRRLLEGALCLREYACSAAAHAPIARYQPQHPIHCGQATKVCNWWEHNSAGPALQPALVPAGRPQGQVPAVSQVPSATGLHPRPCCLPCLRGTTPVHTMSSPEALGSSVPAWPTLLMPAGQGSGRAG